MKLFKYSPLIIATYAILGYLLLLLAYSIPVDLMQKRLAQSIDIYKKETTYHNPAAAQLDNFTDALMLLTAAYPREESIFRDAVHAKRFSIVNKDPTESLVALFDKEEAHVKKISYPYGRYWHGYLVFLKPLLSIFKVQNIRSLLAAIQLLLFTVAIVQLAKMHKNHHIFSLLALMIFLNPIATMSSLQFTNVYLSMYFCLLFVLFKCDKWEIDSHKWGFVFLTTGCLTSYLDLLTYPLVSLGVPLAAFISLCKIPKGKHYLLAILLFSSLWAIGYVGMWTSKWILGSLIADDNLILNGINAIQHRLHGEISYIGEYSIYDVIKPQIGASLRQGAVMVIAICIVLLLAKLIKTSRLNLDMGKSQAYFIICLFPFLWYLFVQNHSFEHWWFTYRELGISLYAFCLFLVDCHVKAKHHKDTI